MDPKPRKHRFVPKAPPRNRKPSVSKPEEDAGDPEGADAKNLIARFNDIQGLQRPKVEKKSSAQVAFGPGAESSSKLLRTFGPQRAGDVKDTCFATNISAAHNEQLNSISSSHSAVKEDSDGFSSDSSYEAAPNTKKEYREPWDHDTDYPPITLPLRKPNSGDPELLDKAEFGEEATEYDDNAVNAAKELGLLEISEEPVLLFVKLPPQLPFEKPSASRKGKEKADSSLSSERSGAVKKCSDLEELPAGCLGKMLVYKSGRVKLKLGETPYDVSPGLHTEFAQNVAAINTEEKQCCNIGNFDKRVVVTPDIDSLLNSMNDSGSPEKKQKSELPRKKQTSGSLQRNRVNRNC